MARYFKTGGTAWNNANDWSANSPASGDNAGVPGIGDDVIFTNASGSCALNTVGGVCRSFDQGTGGTKYTATFSGTASLTVGTSTAPPGGIAIRLSSSCTWSHIGAVSVSGTATGTVTITCATQTFGGAFTIGVSTALATIQFADAFACVGTFTKSSTSLFDTTGQTVTTGSISWTGNTAGTITCGASVWTCTASLSMTTGGSTTNGVFVANSSEFKLTALTATITVSGNAKNFYNLTRIGTAAVNATWIINGDLTVTNTLSVGGNTQQGANRLLVVALAVNSSLYGTVQRTLTLTGATLLITGDVNWTDMIVVGSPTLSNSSSSYMGNCGGNTGITFTGATTLYGVVAGNWSSTGVWSTSSGGSTGARSPLPQDTVRLDGSSGAGTYQVDMPCTGGDLDFTGFTRTFRCQYDGMCIYGSLTFVSGMTYTSSLSEKALLGRGTHTITMAGKSWGDGSRSGNIGVSGPTSATNSVYTFQDAMNNNSAAGGSLNFSGTINANNQSVSCTGTGSICTIINSITVLNMGGGVWSANGPATGNVTFWSNTAGGTINHQNSEIKLLVAFTGTATFAGGGSTYYQLTYTVANSPGLLSITGNNTWNGSPAWIFGPGRPVQMASGSVQTFTGANAIGVLGQNYGYLYLPGITTNYASSPDIPAYTGAGIMRITMRVSMDDWSPTASNILMCHGTNTANVGWQFLVPSGTSVLQLSVSIDGSASNIANSTAHGLTDGTTYWVGVEYNCSTGAVSFYKANDAIAEPAIWGGWTLISSTTNPSGVPFNSTAALILGEREQFGRPLSGRLYKACLRNNTTTLDFHADFTSKVVGINTFKDSSTNNADITIVGALAIPGDGRIEIKASTGGSRATLSLSSLTVSTMRYVKLTDIAVLPKGHLYALDSVDGGNNDGPTINQPVGWGIAV